MNAYRKDFDETKYMSFLIKNELLEKYNEIWEKVKNSIEKEFVSELIYNEKYLKAKMKMYNGKTNTNFHHFSQVFLEECKYVSKEKEIPVYIINDTEISFDFER